MHRFNLSRRSGVLGVVLVALGLGACARSAAPAGTTAANLLLGRAPLQAIGLIHPERITDGVEPRAGDFWRTDLTAVFATRSSAMIYDLSQPTPISAIYLNGDNNDRFIVQGSLDNRVYYPIWTAKEVAHQGMQARYQAGLEKNARYLRITIRGGDPSVSLGELAVYPTTPATWPPIFPRASGHSPMQRLNWAMGCFIGGLILLVLIGDRRLPFWLPILAAVGALVAFLYVIDPLKQLWPIDQHAIGGLRLFIALGGTLVLGRFFYKRQFLRKWPAYLSVAVLGLLGVLAFYNLGRPQFHNAKTGKPSYVHTYDTRVYYPVAKYFDELGYDGVYWASLATYAEGKNRPLSSMGHVLLRDLRNNQMVHARDVLEQIRQIKKRFTEPRWKALKEDMRWFWETMGSGGYLGSLRDHGGNATPVWLLAANLIWRFAPASENLLLLTGLIDPALLVLLFFAIGRAYGWRTSLVALLIFGATDFPMLGSNWGGATMRFTWIVFLGLGACAFKRRHFALGGILMALGALMRAFPVVAVFAFALPGLWAIGAALRRRESLGATLRMPSLKPLYRATAGTIAISLILFVSVGAVFSFSQSWGGWKEKISLHATKPNVNHVGFRALTAYHPSRVARKVLQQKHPEPWVQWQKLQLSTIESRKAILWLGTLLFVALVVLASRGARLDQAALLGTMLIPVLFYPANYYCHYIFLLPLLADDDESAGGLWVWNSIWLVGFCAAQYASIRMWTDERFALQSAVLVVTYLAILIPMVRKALIQPTSPPSSTAPSYCQS